MPRGGASEPEPADPAFLDGLTDSSLYAIGAYFCDQHPELVQDVLDQSVAIEQAGLAAWAAAESTSLPDAFQTLMTGLAVRYFAAVTGPDL